jgi:adenylate cyclase
MTDPRSRRKLTAILSADVVGYSRLMAANEAATVETLKSYRDIIARLVVRHGGRVVNAPGDALLVEFPSAVEAVQTAVEIQKSLEGHNIDLEPERRMQFRIGVNLGDVIEEGDGTIYGDGVNIAARMEALAEAGGVCISSTVYDAVEGKLSFGFDFLGEHQVKNIQKPVRAYRVRPDPRTPPARRGVWRLSPRVRFPVIGAALLTAVGAAGVWYLMLRQAPAPAVSDGGPPLRGQPSIAVLPFVNIGGDPKQEYFADGVTETVIADLSKLRALKVIARNSVFTYKGKAADVRDVSQKLGVRYVLEGSVQKAGTRIRVTTQLIDATTGEHLWAERYDRAIEDLFSLQDEIATRVVTEMDVKLAEGESAREWRRTTRVPEAYDYFLRARQAQVLFTRQDMIRARDLAERALEVDPNFAMAHWMAGQTRYEEAAAGWVTDPRRSFEMARASYQRAIQLDDSLGIAYSMLGAVSLSLDLDHDRAVEFGRKAIAVNPNGAFEYAALSVFLAYSGYSEEALLTIEQAFQRNPIPEGWYYHPLGAALLFLGRTEEAIEKLDECVRRLPTYIYCNVNLTVAHMLMGNEEKARAQAKQLLRINPNFSSDSAVPIRRIKDPGVRDRFTAALKRAGLP